MRRLVTTAILALSLLALGGVAALGQSSDSAGPTRTEAVAIVLDSDPRFADLADWEELLRDAQAEFRALETMISADYYRVLGPTMSQWYDSELVTLRYPRSWLIETTLVEDCVEPATDDWPVEDPCAWRHTWLHHVGPAGSLALVFEEGDPEPMPDSDEPTE